MANIPKPSSDILRRNAEKECGTPVGQMNIKIHDFPSYQTVSFYCTKPRLHTDECAFVGSGVMVTARRRDDGKDSIILPNP